MTPTCESVAERIALGEPLGELAAHLATCARCQYVAVLPARLGVTRHVVEPGPGFAARVTTGARQRLVVRRRRRVAVGLGGAVLVGALAVFVIARPTPSAEPAGAVGTAPQPAPPEPIPDPWTDPVTDGSDDADLRALVELADIHRSSRLSADWAQIEKPLAPYRRLLRGVSP